MTNKKNIFSHYFYKYNNKAPISLSLQAHNCLLRFHLCSTLHHLQSIPHHTHCVPQLVAGPVCFAVQILMAAISLLCFRMISGRIWLVSTVRARHLRGREGVSKGASLDELRFRRTEESQERSDMLPLHCIQSVSWTVHCQ